MDNSRPTWAEIDLAAIEHNLASIRRAAGPARIMAVVKANAYGHGVEEISHVCQKWGVDYFGVASLEEAMELRQAGITAPILTLGYLPEASADAAVAADVTPCIFTFDAAEAFSKAAQAAGKKAKVHVKLDTGMGRLGFKLQEESLELVEKIAGLPGIELEGILTHFAEADGYSETFTRKQLDLFSDFIRELESRGHHIPLKHCANSAAIFRYPEAIFDMVRAGIVLYGLAPSAAMKAELDIIPAMTLKSQVSYVKKLPAGYPVSYGRRYYCREETMVATVPIGYADGYNRLLSNRSWGMIKGHSVPLIGTVCMDQCMFNVSGVEGVKTGDEIILFGKPEDGVTADDLATLIGTINYEIVCSLGVRVPRYYRRSQV